MTLLKQGIENKSVIPTEMRKKIDIDNHVETYSVYKIKLDQLYYNDQNDRIATWISQYKMENNIKSIDMSDITYYNNIIHNFITESNREALNNTQNNIKLIGQQEYGVVLADGRIIDGNRRFTCLRNIEKETGKTQYFEAIILEHDFVCNAKQIKKLELRLQHGVDEKVEYNPVERLVGIYNDIVDKELLTVEEYADSVSKTKGEIEIEVEKAKLLVEYLEFINAPKQFHIARTMNLSDPLKELYVILKKCKDNDVREDLKNVVFSQFLIQPFGDMTRYMRKIKKIASKSKFLDKYLEEQLELTEKVCDIIEELPTVTSKEINEKIRTQEDIKKAFSHSTEKWINKVDGDATRNQPAKQAEKAYDSLDLIDKNIFKKLSDDQKDDIRSKLDMIEEIILSIRSELDV